MTTNREWLYSLDVADLSDWFDAEHVDANDDLAPESDVRADAVDANDENATCNNSGDFVTDDSREKLEASNQQISQSDAQKSEETAENTTTKNDIHDFDDSREKLEADVLKRYTHTVSTAMWPPSANKHTNMVSVSIDTVLGWLDRQAEITHAETIHTYNLDAREARKVQEERIADLEEEIAKRDKGIARLKRQRDTARAKIDELHAECDTCCYKTDYIEMDFLDVDRLTQERDKAREMFCMLRDEITDERNEHEDAIEKLIAHCDELQDKVDKLEAERDALRAANTALKADGDERPPRAVKKRDEVIKILKTERDALAADLRDSEHQRERLRQALGCAIDHAHEVVSLVDIDKEVAR